MDENELLTENVEYVVVHTDMMNNHLWIPKLFNVFYHQIMIEMHHLIKSLADYVECKIDKTNVG